jgi:hypothetical protein
MLHENGGVCSSSRSIWLGRSPLILAVAIICALSAFNLNRLVRYSSPRDPWESTEVMEAWRSMYGMPVYELGRNGHSTHVYGALVPWVQGEIFRWTGPNNISGRVLSLVCGLVTVTLLAGLMCGKRSAWYFAMAWTLLLAVNQRAGQYFAENRPDVPALMLSTFGVLFLAYGQEQQRGRFVLLGTAFLVGGFFFKQTALIFAAVPLIALVLRATRPLRRELVLAIVPVVAALGVVLLLRVFSPAVYHYMIDVPRAFARYWERTAKTVIELLMDTPLFLVLLGVWLGTDRRSFRADARLRWVLAEMCVAIPFSTISFAKAGGSSNSFLPALLGIMSFCALRLPRLLGRWESANTRLSSRVILGSLVAILMLMSCYPCLTGESGVLAVSTPWDGDYMRVVSMARQLDGTVVCPEDPTIPLYAKGYVGRGIFAEYDTHLINGEWPSSPPDVVLANFGVADYLVDVAGFWQDLVRAPLLEALGFEPADDLPFRSAFYRIWRRRRIATSWNTRPAVP